MLAAITDPAAWNTLILLLLLMPIAMFMAIWLMAIRINTRDARDSIARIERILLRGMDVYLFHARQQGPTEAIRTAVATVATEESEK